MTATVETAPEEIAKPPEAPGEQAKAARGDRHRHRTVRHVAVHGGSASVVSVAAEVLHVFGPSALGLGAAGVAAAGAGVVAVRKRGKSPRGSRKTSLARTMRRTIKSAAGTRTAAGLRHSKSAAGASGRTPHAAASRRTAAAGLRGGASRRAAGAASGARRSGGGTLHRRTRKPSITGGRAKPRSGTGRAAGSSGRPGVAGAAPRGARLGNKVMRRLTRASRTKQAAATRPAGRHAAPVTRAGRIRKQASIRGRHATRLARRSAARSWRFAKAGAKASRPFLRLRPPKTETPPTPEKQTKPAAKLAAAKKPTSKPVKKAPTRPGRAINAPGLTVKEIMSATAPSAGITAATDAITEHIAGFEPENALDIEAFLGGLDHLFTALGSSLVTVSERLGGEHPVDASVVEHVQQLGAHALTLAEYGVQSHTLFRAAHESELSRLENPRMREEDWDVERNR